MLMYTVRREMLHIIHTMAIPRTALACLGMALIVFLVRRPGTGGLLLSLGVAIVSYGALVILLKAVNKEEKVFIVRTIREKLYQKKS
jgi:ribulose-5-phosphate 4-epimerase/fuculose-1-phosphate aldolase